MWNKTMLLSAFRGNKAISEAWQEKRWTWGQNRKCKRIRQEILWTRDMRNIINHDEQCIKLLHFMLPVDKSKKYCRSCEFRHIICPLNKHSQNKPNFGKIFKFQAFEVDINNNSISCNCYVKMNKITWNKGE